MDTLASDAIQELTSIKHTYADATKMAATLQGAGLYAFHARPAEWTELGLEARREVIPLYVGKAEESMADRDLKQHFQEGMTSFSTLRRSIAALLRPQLGWRGIPRNKAKPGRFSHYTMEDKHEQALSEWMKSKLTIAFWRSPNNFPKLLVVETAVIARLTPPLNIKDNKQSRAIKLVRQARAAMAAEARAWRPAT